ncbi:tyrosine-type recombinase/integrase [Paracidovorax wautersii]|nr:site-specific integrase [Paracidovorax wautersii]
MPTIRKKGDRQWHVQVRKRGYPRQTRTFSTRADAEKWGTIVEAEMERGVFVSRTEAETTTLREVAERYRREVLPTKRGAAADASRLKTLLTHFGDFKLAAITSSLVAQFRDLRLQSVGPQSVIHEINLLNRVLKAATMDWGIALPGGLPTAQVRKPSKPRGRERRVSQEEINTILAQTGSTELGAIVGLAIETAMRRGELAALTWEHVDLEQCVAHLPQTKTDVARDVPLSSIAIAIFKSISGPHVGCVFKMRAESMSQALERACGPHRANIVNLHFHDLRHEATSRLFEKGLNVMEVAAITGHKTLDMLKRYTHLKAHALAKRLG